MYVQFNIQLDMFVNIHVYRQLEHAIVIFQVHFGRKCGPYKIKIAYPVYQSDVKRKQNGIMDCYLKKRKKRKKEGIRDAKNFVSCNLSVTS